jgi:Uma2 family endonuclease
MQAREVDMPLTTLSQDTDALFEELFKQDCKAEIVEGEIRRMPPTGEEPALSSFEIAASLREHARSTGHGRAFADNATFRVDLPNRKSFSPDAAFIDRPRSGSMGAVNSAPIFAVEVRSENDYGPTAEAEMAKKRADYFAAGTQVVWDVDLLSEDVVRKYTAAEPDKPVVFKRGDVANAEPAVPGWRMGVDEMFV